MTTIAHPELEGLERYKFGWADSDVAGVGQFAIRAAGVCPTKSCRDVSPKRPKGEPKSWRRERRRAIVR